MFGKTFEVFDEPMVPLLATRLNPSHNPRPLLAVTGKGCFELGHIAFGTKSLRFPSPEFLSLLFPFLLVVHLLITFRRRILLRFCRCLGSFVLFVYISALDRQIPLPFLLKSFSSAAGHALFVLSLPSGRLPGAGESKFQFLFQRLADLLTNFQAGARPQRHDHNGAAGARNRQQDNLPNRKERESTTVDAETAAAAQKETVTMFETMMLPTTVIRVETQIQAATDVSISTTTVRRSLADFLIC